MIQRLIILFSYIVMGVAIIIGTIILVEYGQGYSYDFSSGKFSLNGLVVLQSNPTGAAVYINGHQIHRKTPYRDTLKTGTYNLELRRDGYRTWTKQVDIQPYQVSLLDSIFLVPTTIKTDNVTPNQPVASLIASRDRRHFAYITGDPVPALWVINPDSKQGTKVYSPQAATADHPAETLVDASWSEDGSHLLVHGQIGSTQQYTLVGAGGGTPTNLTDLFKFDFSGLRFSSYDWHELYWNSPSGLRKINVGAKTASAVLASGVSAYTFGPNRILYIQTTPTGKSLWSEDFSGGNQKELIESLAENASYQLEYASYAGHDLLAVLPAQTATVTVYSDIFSPTPTAKVISKSAQRISFSANGRYLAYFNSTGFGTYDVDQAGFLFTKEAPGSLTCLTWFDNAHVVVCHGQEAELVELDGANSTPIAPIVPGTPVFGSLDLRHIYTIEVPASGTPPAIYDSSVKG